MCYHVSRPPLTSIPQDRILQAFRSSSGEGLSGRNCDVPSNLPSMDQDRDRAGNGLKKEYDPFIWGFSETVTF